MTQITGVLLFILIGFNCFAITPDEMVKKADDFRFINVDTSFYVDIRDFKGSETQDTKYKVYNKGTQFSRVETILPERQAGRKLLMKSDDLWFYTPDIKRPTRVSMQQKLTGEVSNGDIARTNFGEDYSAELRGEEKIGNTPCFRLYLKKRRDGVTYPAIDYWVAKKDYLPIKATFKTDSGKDLKTAYYKDIKKTLGRPILTRIEIASDISKNQKSILVFKTYKKEKLDESFFNKESLSN